MRRVALLSILLVAGACGGQPRAAGTGSAEVIAVTSSALSQADVESVALSISGQDIHPAITTSLAHVGNKFQGIVGGIPVGADRTFHGEGDDDLPVIDTTFQASDTVDGGGTLTFRASGHDPGGGAVTYTWSSDVGSVVATGGSALWTAPACMSGDAQISVVVSNGSASTTQTFTVTPSASSGCAATVERVA